MLSLLVILLVIFVLVRQRRGSHAVTWTQLLLCFSAVFALDVMVIGTLLVLHHLKLV